MFAFFELMKKIETGTYFEYVNNKIEKAEIVFEKHEPFFEFWNKLGRHLNHEDFLNLWTNYEILNKYESMNIFLVCEQILENS